jgi:hypothetical protein
MPANAKSLYKGLLSVSKGLERAKRRQLTVGSNELKNAPEF